MAVLEHIKELGKALPYPETWVRKSALFPLITCALGVTELICLALDVSKVKQLFATPIAAVLMVIAWAIGRELYWRRGRGRKVGISFEAFQVAMEDWVSIRRELSLLCESFTAEERVHLKLLPSNATSTDERWDRTIAKYRMPLVFRVEASPKVQKKEGDDQPVLRVQVRMRFDVALTQEFVDATNVHARKLCVTTKPESLKELVRFRAATIFDCISLYLGVIDYTRGRYPTATRFLQRLDSRLADRLSVDQYPRKAIRWLAALCMIQPSVFPADAPPEPDDLLAATERAQEAVGFYGAEFPYLYVQLARDFFYVRQMEEAIKVSETALLHVAQLEAFQRASAILNLGVLNLLIDKPAPAHQFLSQFFAMHEAKQFNWPDLINFADFAQDYGYPNAVYLRALYRKFAGVDIPGDLRTRLTKFIAVTPQRNELGALYHTLAPIVSGSPVKLAKVSGGKHGPTGKKQKKRGKRRK